MNEVAAAVESAAASSSFAAGPVGCACAIRSSEGSAQALWAAMAVAERVRVLRGARHRLAAGAESVCAAISPALPRSTADTLTAELMPLLDACKFLEKSAGRLLRPHTLGRRGQPLWLRGVAAEVHRVPLGEVLVIGPANFPLFLPGVQVLQALTAGNGVVWKPAPGGWGVAELVLQALEQAGLPRGLLRVTDESVEAARHALADRPAKVVFTGSYETGCAVLAELAKTATPAVMELSGADAVAVLPDADLVRVAKAIAFGLRLNGGQVCMSPRRLFATASTMARLLPVLLRELSEVPPVALSECSASLLRGLVDEARASGAEVRGEIDPAAQRPLLILNARPNMRIAQTDVFAPVLSMLELPALTMLPDACAASPYALTVSIFCGRDEEAQARSLGMELKAGTVLINDLIAPTADPRVPFGGRGASGFGVTRGAEGLLEMTATKVLLIRRGGAMRHLDATGEADSPLLASLVRMVHAGTWRERWRAMMQVASLGRQRGATAKDSTRNRDSNREQA